MQTSQHHHRRIAQIKRHHRYHTQIQIKSGLAQVDAASTSSLPFSHIIACRLRNISITSRLEHIIINSSSSNADFFASSLSQTHDIAAIHSLIAQNLLPWSQVDV